MSDFTMHEQVQNGKDVIESLHRTLNSLEKSEVRSKIHEHADHLLFIFQNLDKQLDKAPGDPDTIVESIISQAVNEVATDIESEEERVGFPISTLPKEFDGRQLVKRMSLKYTANHYLDKSVIADFKQRLGVLRHQLLKAIKDTVEGVLAKDAETATLGQILQ